MSHCGAKRRNGEACKAPAMHNGRCRIHGGKTATKGNKYAVKHNIYSQFMTQDENVLSESLDLTSLDDELKLTKIQLMRALKAQAEVDSKTHIEQLELTEYVDRELPTISTAAKSEEVYKRKDFDSVIERLKGRIESLTMKRQQLIDNALHSDLDAQIKRLEIAKREKDALNPTTDGLDIVISRAQKDAS